MSMSRTKKLQITAAIIILMAAVCFLWHFRYFFTGPDTTPVHDHSNADFGIPEFKVPSIWMETALMTKPIF